MDGMSRSGAPAQPRNAGISQPARLTGAGSFVRQAAGDSRGGGCLLGRAPAGAARAMRRAGRSALAHFVFAGRRASADAQRRRRDSYWRRRSARRVARPEPQQQAIHCADRAARAPAHRHRVAEGEVQLRLRLLPGDFEGQPASCSSRLRAQADAGQRRALHHARAEGIRSEGAGCAGEDDRDRAAAVCRAAGGHCRRGTAHSADRAGAGGDRRAGVVRHTCSQSQLLPSAVRGGRRSGDRRLAVIR